MIGEPLSYRDKAMRLWSAARLIRRAPLRNKSIAITILKELATTETGLVQQRAAELIRKINGEQSGSDKN